MLLWALTTTFALADLSCADDCQLGQVSGNAVCGLWDSARRTWIDEIDDGAGQLHNRARVYLPWLRERLMPAGGVMAATFSDPGYQQVASYVGVRDPAIWTGSYLAAEALRYLATGAPDAKAQLAETLQVLHRWWNIPGDPGYLARFAAPEDSAPEILAALPADDDEVHPNQLYEGAPWRWRGDVSRDQYQGVVLGYSLAYEATQDEALRALIREDVVELAEQLMRRERRRVALIIGGQRTELQIDLENVVYNTSEMLDGLPTLEIDLGTQEVQGHGLLVFWPSPSEYLRQIPGLSWLPDLKLPTQAVQLAGIFRVALQVTDGVAGYEQRRQALSDYYERHYSDWLGIASKWRDTSRCGDSYHGLNIAFMPMFSWARLEPDPTRREQVRRDVLASRMWPAVATHKNVFFAFIYGSQAPAGTDIDGVVSAHADQLAGFPLAPNAAVPVDLRGVYPEDPACPGLSAVAIDVGDRVPASFLWERQPWKLQDPGLPNGLYGGVDYLLAYWLGRYFGFIEDDAPGTCLTYRASDPAVWIPPAMALVDSAWTFVPAASGFPDAIVIAGPPSYKGADPGVVRLRGIGAGGFEMRFQEWDYRERELGDTSHTLEQVPYALLRPGRHLMPDGSVWEVGSFALGGTAAWQAVPFSEPFAEPPHVFLTIQTTLGGQAVSTRVRNVTVDGFEAALFEEEALMDGHAVETIGYLAITSPPGGGVLELSRPATPYLLQRIAVDYRWTPVLSQRIKLEEEQSWDGEIEHTDETLDVLALGDQVFAQQVTHNGGDTTAPRRLAPTGDAPMEWGLIRGVDQNWQTLPFAKTYTDPVLVAKPASSNGADPGVVRIRGLGVDHAQLRYQEWGYLDGSHTREDLFYLVSEAGEHSLGGLAVEAGRVQTDKLGRAGQWEAIAFAPLFLADPVTLSSVMTYNGTDTVTTRVRGLGPLGFGLAMDEQESKSDGHTLETLGWVAIEAGHAITGEGRRLDASFAPIDHNLTSVLYATPTAHRYPSIVADIDSANGMDPVFLRYAKPTNSQIQLRLGEEQSLDAETGHVLEDVGLFIGE